MFEETVLAPFHLFWSNSVYSWMLTILRVSIQNGFIQYVIRPNPVLPDSSNRVPAIGPFGNDPLPYP